MTPDWLYKHSTITKPFFVYPKYLEILAGKNFECLVQAELITPNILTTTDSVYVVVTLTIAMDTALADSGVDHDSSFGISDGNSFVGYKVIDKDNYANAVPCYKNEGDTIDNMLHNRVIQQTGTRVNSQHFPVWTD